MVERRDYSLAGAETKRAFERGLVSGEWYKPEISRARMKELMRRSDFPALWHLLLWLGLVAGLGAIMYVLWPLQHPSRRLVGPALARMWSRHRVQDRLVEQRGVPIRLLQAVAGAGGLALESHPPPHRFHRRWPRSRDHHPAAPGFPDAVHCRVQPPSVQTQGRCAHLPARLHPRAGHQDLSRKRFRARIRVAQGVLDGAGVARGVGGGRGDRGPHGVDSAVLLRRAALVLRPLAGARLRCHPAPRARRRRPGPSPQRAPST